MALRGTLMTLLLFCFGLVGVGVRRPETQHCFSETIYPIVKGTASFDETVTRAGRELDEDKGEPKRVDAAIARLERWYRRIVRGKQYKPLFRPDFELKKKGLHICVETARADTGDIAATTFPQAYTYEDAREIDGVKVPVVVDGNGPLSIHLMPSQIAPLSVGNREMTENEKRSRNIRLSLILLHEAFHVHNCRQEHWPSGAKDELELKAYTWFNEQLGVISADLNDQITDSQHTSGASSLTPEGLAEARQELDEIALYQSTAIAEMMRLRK